MIIKTATLIAAGLVLAGSCLTAALVMGAEPAQAPVSVPVAPTPVAAAPAVAKAAWATDSGKDQYGAWADLKVADVTQRFRWIQPGTFTMGSSQAEKDAAVQAGAKPEWVAPEVQHQVTLTQGFWLADSACTQALWQAITGSNPANFKDSPQNPVEQVSWDDCQQFLSKLNGRVSGGGFRLPSEAQWEYACRAGTTTAFSFGSTITPEQVNYDGNFPFAGAAKGLYRQKTVPVKSLPPNGWGLYEMHGNVWQWCNDWYGDFSGSAERDPAGPSSGSSRVSRGGSWDGRAGDCRSANRYGSTPDDRRNNLGFRIAAQATP
jgi:formylglycine-generating enzyme required for sulfatase activity